MNIVGSLAAGMMVFATLLTAQPAEKAADPAKEREETSYCIGQDVGKALSSQEIDVDLDLFMKGFRDAMEGKKSRYTEEQFHAIMNRFRQDQMVKQQSRMSRLAEENLAKGADFLAANRKKKGVQTTPSGLQYKVVKRGTGPRPSSESTVEVHYTGRLIDGTEFDSSVKRGQPAIFPVGGVIPGWTEALLMMNTGAKYELVIPAELAYGERGAGPIPPHAVLIFDVELISIKEGGPPPPPGR